MTSHPSTLPRRGAAARLWGETWRLLLSTSLGLLLFLLVWFSDDAVMASMSPTRFAVLVLLDVALGVVALVLLPLRHRAPVALTTVAAVLASVSSLGAVAAALMLVSLATRRRPVEIGVVGGVSVAAAVASEQVVLRTADDVPLWMSLALVLVVTAALVLTGLYVGGRRELLRSLRERARLAEAEQESRLAQAREHERTAIAREMHDVLAHRLSLIALHAGALEYRAGLDPAAATATAGVVRDAARSALIELREVLGVLREPTGVDGAEADARVAPPQPTLADLDDLLLDAREGGTDVVLEIDDAVRVALADVSPTTGRHAFRILQECLTNARRHASGRPVSVAVSGRPGRELLLVVENPLTHRAVASSEPTRGHGLVGVAERARLAGGSAVVVHDEARHRVEVRLPWPA